MTGNVTITVPAARVAEITVVDDSSVEIEEEIDYSTVNYIVFTSEEAGNSLTFRVYNDYMCDFTDYPSDWESIGATFYYSYDNENYTLASRETAIGFDSKLYIRGKALHNATVHTYESCDQLMQNSVQISLSKNALVAGNIMALLDYENVSTVTLGERAFASLFINNDKLTNASKLVLPATTLTEQCYEAMFSGCTSLIAAPELPATTLDKNCYSGMFMNCSNLTESPILPALSVPEGMWGAGAYANMFKGCSNLTKVTCLATSLASINGWLQGTASSGTLFKNPSADCWTVGTNVPSGWTIQDYTE